MPILYSTSFTPDDIIKNNFPQAWNKLPDVVKILRSKLLFKKSTKELKIGEYKPKLIVHLCVIYSTTNDDPAPQKEKNYPCIDP